MQLHAGNYGSMDSNNENVRKLRGEVGMVYVLTTTREDGTLLAMATQFRFRWHDLWFTYGGAPG